MGVKKPDLYNHFRDKRELYVAVRMRALHRAGTALRVAVESGMSEATFRRALNDLLNHRDLINDGTASRSHYRTP